MTTAEAKRALSAAVESLRASIARNEERLRRDIERWPEVGLAPDDMLDRGGRPILLDARAALVNGLVALQGAER